MFKCAECEAIFDEPAIWKENRGEFWGFPAHELMAGCPQCKGAFEEAYICKICGEWFFKDELTDGLCESCQEEINV